MALWVQRDRLVVAGPVLSALPAGAAAMGVRFRVGAAGRALGHPARDLLDETVALADLLGAAEAGALAERLETAATAGARLALRMLRANGRLRAPEPSHR
jgi:hypothetical protein